MTVIPTYVPDPIAEAQRQRQQMERALGSPYVTTPPVPTLEQVNRFREGAPDTAGALKAAAEVNWLIPSWKRAIAASEAGTVRSPDGSSAHLIDPDWLNDPEQWKEVTEGLDPSHYASFTGATSRQQALQIRANILRVETLKTDMAKAGFAGSTANVLTSLSDPVDLAAYILAPIAVFGTARKASRVGKLMEKGLATGMKSAELESSVTAAIKGGRAAFVADAALTAAATTAGVESLHVAVDDDRDGWDILHSAVAGLAGGAGFGGVLGALSDRRLMKNAQRILKDVRASEAIDSGAALTAAGEAYLAQKGLERGFDTDALGELVKSRSTSAEGLVPRGSLSDYLADPKVRELYTDALDVPVYAATREAAGMANLRKGTGLDAAFGTVDGKAAIFVFTDDPQKAAEALLHEGGHALRYSKGRAMAASDFDNLSPEELAQLPEEVSANKLASHVKVLLGKSVAEPVNMDQFVDSITDIMWNASSKATGEKGRDIYRAAFGMSGRVQRSPEGFQFFEDTRRMVRMLVEQSIPTDGAHPAVYSLAEAADYANRILLADVAPRFHATFNTWFKGKGYNALRRLEAATEFQTELSRVIRSERGSYKTSPEIDALANRMRDHYARQLDRLKRQKVKGFEEIPPSDTYMARVGLPAAIAKMSSEIGKDNVLALIEGAVRSAQPHLTDRQAAAFAKAWYKVHYSRAFQSSTTAKVISGFDEEGLSAILKQEHGLADDEIEGILYEITPKSTGNAVARSKRRMGIDEQYSTLLNLPGGQREVRFDELLDNDALGLFYRYHRQTNGAIAEQKILEAFPKNDRGELYASLDHLFEAMERRSADEIPFEMRRKAMADLDRLKTLSRIVRSIPTDQAIPEDVSTVLRWIRKYNYARIAGKFGLAQLPETGYILGDVGLKAAGRVAPDLPAFVARAKDGTLSHETLSVLQTVMGMGIDEYGMHMVRMEGLEHASFAANKVDDYLDAAGRVMSQASGMTAITRYQQQFASAAIFQRFIDQASGATAAFSPERLASMGLTDAQLKAINANILKHATGQTGAMGVSFKNANLHLWDDQAAADLIMAVNRTANRLVLRPNAGQLAAWMTSDIARPFLQFRSFVLSAWEKQMLYGLSMRDMQTATSWLGSMTFGSMTYAAIVQTNALGREDAQEYRDKMLSGRRMVAGSIARAGFTSAVPGLIDTMLLPALGTDGLFSGTRASGMSQDVLLGNPTVDLINAFRSTAAAGTRSALNDDWQFSQQDWRTLVRILPFNNVFPIQSFLNKMGGSLDLPRSSQVPQSQRE